MLEEGALLQDRYRITRSLGGGGMGRVYLAQDTRLADKPCAIKELLPDPHASADEQERAAAQFQREAAILAHLSHPNLPNVYDYFTEGDHFYLVMDYVQGETLADHLARSPGGVPVETAIVWALQLCDVLDYLHSQQPPVIFRDLKPANVMVTPDGTVKLIDFGVARLFDPSKGTDTLKMGTAGYAPPEQYAGQGQTTPRSDLYSLGVTLHELLTGDDPTAHPFVFTPPSQLNGRVSPALSGVIMRALSLDPDDRFPSARAMKAALQKAAQSRRLPKALVQARRGTGTTVMGEAVALPLPISRRPAVRVALGVIRWIVRLALMVLIAVLVTAIVFTLAGAFLLSAIAQQAIASTDWRLQDSAPGTYTITEADFNESVQDVLVLYTLDALSDVRIDFQVPQRVVLFFTFSSYPMSLQVRLTTQDGVPMVVIERLNDVPLYVVGGIVSNGINRGFRQSWQDSDLLVRSLTVESNRLTVELRR